MRFTPGQFTLRNIPAEQEREAKREQDARGEAAPGQLATYMGTLTDAQARKKLIAKWGYMPHSILGDAKNYQPVCTMPEGHIGFCGLVGPPSSPMSAETLRVLRGEASGRTPDVGRPRLRWARRLVGEWLERVAGEIRV